MITANNKLSSVEMLRHEDSVRRRIINKTAARQLAVSKHEQQQQPRHQMRQLESRSFRTGGGRAPRDYHDDLTYTERHLAADNVHGGGDSLDYRQSLLKLKYMRSHQAKLRHAMHEQYLDDNDATAEEGQTSLLTSTNQQRLRLAPGQSLAGTGRGRFAAISNTNNTTSSTSSRDVQKSSGRILSVLRASESKRQRQQQLADEEEKRLAQIHHQQQQHQHYYADDVTSYAVTSPLTISSPLVLLQRDFTPPPVPPNSSCSRKKRHTRRVGNHHLGNESSSTSPIVVYMPSADSHDDCANTPTPENGNAAFTS